MNIYISYISNQWPRCLNKDFTLGSCLFGYVKLTKNANLDKHKFTAYDIGFDCRSEFSFTDDRMKKKNVIFFETDMSSSMLTDHKTKIYQFLVKVQHKD